MNLITAIAAWLHRVAKQLGPYAMLELLLPGGSLFALALFLYRRSRAASKVDCAAAISQGAIGSI